MITKEKMIDGHCFKASCHEALAIQAEWLLAVFERIESTRGPGFLAKSPRVQVGWSILTVLEQEGSFAICEPDFSRNPFEHVRMDLSTTLSVQLSQNLVAKALGVEPLFATFQDRVAASSEVFSKRRIYVERQIPDKADSGWYIGEADEDTPVNLESKFVYELLRLRPALLSVLILPVGFLAVFSEDTLEAILDGSNEMVDLKSLPAELGEILLNLTRQP